MTLIGLMGQKRSGKDTAASVLTSACGYRRFAFADPMKDALLRVDPVVSCDLRLSTVVTVIAWEGAKTYPEVRRLLQEFGVAIREIQPDFWIRATLEPALASDKPVVITDVRFPNEADAIHDAGGVLIRVDRPGLPDDDEHVSEHAWRSIPADYTVQNDSTVNALHSRITDIACGL